MKISDINSQFDTYAQHKNAVNTIALCLNVPPTRILPELDRRIHSRATRLKSSPSPLYARHRHAIETVAQCSGLSVDEVAGLLEKRLRNRHSQTVAPAGYAGIAVAGN